MDSTIFKSQDGSDSLISAKFEVSYHSKYGAIEESMVVFIQSGLNYEGLKDASPIKIFELGFGTGLNPLLSLITSQNQSRQVEYTGIEAYPIDLSIVNRLNYPKLIKGTDATHFYGMHGADVENDIFDLRITPHFLFNKRIGKMEDYVMEDQYHIIYFDAFAPSSQPELWNENILKKCYNALEEGGVLVTYCAKGAFKRLLKSIGFVVEALPGPTGKREITRAIKGKR